MKRAVADTFRRVWAVLPRSRTLFKLCRMYANFYTGDNNSDMRTNGEARALRALLPGCRVAFDVGANVGEWTDLALRVNPRLHVHCFEPASTTFARLQSHGFPKDQVALNPFGLGERRSEGTLYLHDVSHVNSLHAGAFSGLSAETGSEKVRIETLDDYCEQQGVGRIDYLKIDVEGHELAVLRGSTRMLGRGAIGHIQLEYSQGYLAAGARFYDVFALLASAGYRCQKVLPQGLELRPSFDPACENYQLSNWVFSHGPPGHG